MFILSIVMLFAFSSNAQFDVKTDVTKDISKCSGLTKTNASLSVTYSKDTSYFLWMRDLTYTHITESFYYSAKEKDMLVFLEACNKSISDSVVIEGLGFTFEPSAMNVKSNEFYDGTNVAKPLIVKAVRISKFNGVSIEYTYVSAEFLKESIAELKK